MPISQAISRSYAVSERFIYVFKASHGVLGLVRAGSYRTFIDKRRPGKDDTGDVEYGQPTSNTHPWLLQDGEVAPGVTFSELKQRRARLATALPDNSIALLPSAPECFMTGVIPYPYRQEADFYYFTGIKQTALAMFHKRSGQDMSYTLFKAETPAHRIIWDGAGLSLSAATSTFGADAAVVLSEASLVRHIKQTVPKVTTMLYDMDRPCAVLQRTLPALFKDLEANRGTKKEPLGRLGLRHSNTLQPLRPLLHPIRWRKSPAEIAALRRSAAATAAALRACIGHTHPGRHESDLAALFNFRCAMRGAQGLSYPPVAGAGENACTVHYGRNDSRLQGGQLMLMDAGCELWGYASDVTRVWPVSGRFSPAQRVVYDHVARTHSECLAALRPGTRLRDVHALSEQLLGDALRDLGVAVDVPGGYQRFYPHSIGHWLGLDTHDCAGVHLDTPLEEGVILTVEPGLYLRGEGVPRQLQGIGVRIEDDVVVTEEGVEVLSGGVPSAVEELEALVGSEAGQWGMVSGLEGDG